MVGRPVGVAMFNTKTFCPQSLLLLLLLLLLTAIELSLGGCSPYTSTDKTDKTKYKRNNTKNTVQTTQNTVNTSTHITKTPTHYKTHTNTHPHITKQAKTTTVQDIPK